MSRVPSIPAEPEVVPVPPVSSAGEVAATDRPDEERRAPLGELLPTGWQATFVVLGAVGLMAGSFAHFGLTGHALLGALVMSSLVLLAAIDVEHGLLPNSVVLPATLVVVVIVALSAPSDLATHVVAGLALGGFFLVFALLRPHALGMGDVKLGLLIGAALGEATLAAMLVASATVFVVALWLVATRGLGARRGMIPFGPFLALGAIVAFLLA